MQQWLHKEMLAAVKCTLPMMSLLAGVAVASQKAGCGISSVLRVKSHKWSCHSRNFRKLDDRQVGNCHVSY